MLYEIFCYMVFTRHSAGKIWSSICISFSLELSNFTFRDDGSTFIERYELQPTVRRGGKGIRIYWKEFLLNIGK